jgi:protein-S-isoprenylcysteine O-methyltransferase Ste14
MGFMFAWWARLTLGDLWSGHVTRKEGHVIVERGPYRLVRHPIYTGLIAAVFALALTIGSPAGLLGAALIAIGFAIKARLEERFLSAELGEAGYADYRRRTPMLVPFWPVKR